MLPFAELKAAATAGKLKVSIELAGDPVEFVFRKPSAREWMDYDAAQIAYVTAVKSSNINTALTKEMMEQAEQLCVRVINSHTAQQLQDLNEEHLGIFFPLALEIAAVIEALRAGAPKAVKSGGASSATDAKASE
jgi:hypothetical protein